MRHLKSTLILTLGFCGILTVSGLAAGGPPAKEGEKTRIVKEERERYDADDLIVGMHKRMMGLKHLRHQAVKAGDVEAVRKIDDSIAAMCKQIDAKFPDAMKLGDDGKDGAKPGKDAKMSPEDMRKRKLKEEEMRKRQTERKESKDAMRSTSSSDKD